MLKRNYPPSASQTRKCFCLDHLEEQKKPSQRHLIRTVPLPHVTSLFLFLFYSDGLVNYEVKLPSSASEVNLGVFTTFTDALTPVPAEILQKDVQLVQYFDSHTVPSKYPTQTQASNEEICIHVALSRASGAHLHLPFHLICYPIITFFYLYVDSKTPSRRQLSRWA